MSVVCGGLKPQLIPVRDTAAGAVAEAEVVWQGSDGTLDQDIEELMPEGPQRTRLDWKNLGKFGPDAGRPPIQASTYNDDRLTLDLGKPPTARARSTAASPSRFGTRR